MQKCKSCGVTIVWVKTLQGRSMPCDPALHFFRRNKAGNEVFVTQYGEVVRGVACDSSRATGRGHTPHWATCPYAIQHKRQPEAPGEQMTLEV